MDQVFIQRDKQSSSPIPWLAWSWSDPGKEREALCFLGPVFPKNNRSLRASQELVNQIGGARGRGPCLAPVVAKTFP